MARKTQAGRERDAERQARKWEDALYAATDYAAVVSAAYKAVWGNATESVQWRSPGKVAPESEVVRCISALPDFVESECSADVLAEANRRAAGMMGDADAYVAARDGGVYVVLADDALADWSAVNEAARTSEHKHPLGPIIDAYQQAHPPTVRIKWRNDPIFPARLVLAKEEDSRAGRLFTPAHYESGEGGGQAYLPGLAPGIEDHAPALPLAFYYAGGKPGSGSGRVAPVALRLWLEMIFAADLKRGGRNQQFEIEQRELLDLLYPNGGLAARSGAVPAVIQACRELDEMRIPIDYEGRGLMAWRVVSVDGRPLRYGAPLVCSVRLPPGSEQGPIIDRRALREYGVTSAPLHRGLLNIAFRLHNPGSTSWPARGGKKYVPVHRDPARYGERLLTPDGNAINEHAARELVRLFYPGDTNTGSVFRQNLKRAIEGLFRLENDKHIRIGDGRIMSPRQRRKPGDGAGK